MRVTVCMPVVMLVDLWMDMVVLLVGVSVLVLRMIVTATVFVVVGGGIVVPLPGGVLMLVRVLDIEVVMAMSMGVAHDRPHTGTVPRRRPDSRRNGMSTTRWSTLRILPAVSSVLAGRILAPCALDPPGSRACSELIDWPGVLDDPRCAVVAADLAGRRLGGWDRRGAAAEAPGRVSSASCPRRMVSLARLACARASSSLRRRG